MVKVEYWHNGSGGFDWLTPHDWKNLEAAGWELHVNKFIGVPTRASKHFDSLDEGVREWEEITKQHPGARGCPCCGVPHTFDAYDENGNLVESFSDYDDEDADWDEDDDLLALDDPDIVETDWELVS